MEQGKKSGKWKIVVAVIVALAIIGAIGSQGTTETEREGSSEPQPTTQEQKKATGADETEDSEPQAPAADAKPDQGTKLEYGELLEENKNDGVVVIKAKIKPSASNKMTIDQNYYNVEDYIKTHDMEGVTELQYWAVADMTDGKESKVISFTVPAALIPRIQSGSVPANTIGEYVEDLWVLPSLK